MRIRNLLLAFWTLVSILALLYLGSKMTEDVVMNNTIFKFTTDRMISIKGIERVSVRAASCNFFILRKGDVVISGKLAEVPLGVPCQEYFVTNSDEVMSSGVWNFEVGKASFEIKTPTRSTITLVLADKVGPWMSISLLVIMIWLFIWLAIYSFFKK